MKVLVACEYSQIVTGAFRRRGHDAFSCDIIPTEGRHEWHIEGDAGRVVNNERWDLLIAHPPCTYLSNSGVRWLHEESGRFDKMRQAAGFFRTLLNADIPQVAVENPIPHKYAVDEIGCQYSQIIRPWQFGGDESKSIRLWLRNLKSLEPTVTRKPDGVKQTHWRMAPGPNRQKERSRFFPEVAQAMAEQWGK